MNQSKSGQLHLVLRRFEGEFIELALTESQRARSSESALCKVATECDGATQVFYLLLGENVAVRPADWKRFSYDHTEVANLVASCVRDNLLRYEFEPVSDATRKLIEKTLTAALQDLGSVFDVDSVQCDNTENCQILVSVNGQYKNGEIATLVVRSQ